MRLVILESPYAQNWRGFTVQQHEEYARAALRDCLLRGEAPIASHLLYTQPGVLDDLVPEQRKLGIAAGLEWRRVAEAAIFYADLGFSSGMLAALEAYRREGFPFETRYLDYKLTHPSAVCNTAPNTVQSNE